MTKPVSVSAPARVWITAWITWLSSHCLSSKSYSGLIKLRALVIHSKPNLATNHHCVALVSRKKNTWQLALAPFSWPTDRTGRSQLIIVWQNILSQGNLLNFMKLFSSASSWCFGVLLLRKILMVNGRCRRINWVCLSCHHWTDGHKTSYRLSLSAGDESWWFFWEQGRSKDNVA